MAFKVDEAAHQNYQRAKNYLFNKRESSENEREKGDILLDNLTIKYGSVVNYSPSWHLLVSHYPDLHRPTTHPSEDIKYYGLDHTIHLAHAFITCPYGDGDEVIESVKKLPEHKEAVINTEKLDIKFYAPRTTPILVKCE